jgi:hypothetical protein
MVRKKLEEDAPSTMLRMVPLPRFAGEDPRRRLLILPRLRGVSSRFGEGKSIAPAARWKASERRDAAQQRGPGWQGTAEGGGGGNADRLLRTSKEPR